MVRVVRVPPQRSRAPQPEREREGGKAGLGIIIVTVLMAAVGVASWVVGEPRLASFLQVRPSSPDLVRASLAVAGMCFLAFLIALWNMTSSSRGRPLNLSIPRAWNTYIVTAAALAAGLLIGTTVFR